MSKKQLKIKTTKSELEQIINEGIWDSLKYYAGKLGSMEKGGKLTGKKEYVAKAKAQFDNTLSKASNAQVKKLVDEITAEFKEFPNQKDKWEFLNATSAIAVFYDSLKAAVEKYKPGAAEDDQEEGAMAPEVANGMVEGLREYVRTLLDVQLADAYKHFTEDEEHDGDQLLEVDWAKKAQELEDEEKAAAEGGEGGEPEGPEDVLKTKEKSGTWKSLESNLLPGALGLAGGGFSAAHYALAQMYLGPNATEIAEEVWRLEKSQAPDEEYENLVQQAMPDVELDSNGGYLRMMTPPGGDPADFAGNVDYWAEKTGRDHTDIIRMMAGQNPNPDYPIDMSDDAGQLLYAYTKENPKGIWGAIGNATTPPSEHFQSWVGTNADVSPETLEALSKPGSMSGHPSAAATLLGVGAGGLTIPGVIKTVAQILKKQGATQFKKVLVQKGAGGAAAAVGGTKMGAIVAGSGILSSLGIALMASGLAVKALRYKGKKASRAQVLNDLEGTLKDFPSTSPLADEPIEEPTPTDECPEGQVMGPDGKCHGTGAVPPEDDTAPPVDPPAPNPEEEDEELGDEDKRLLGLIRMDDDGLKFYRGRRKNPDKRDAEREKMQQAQDNAITGRNTDPSSEDLRNFFGKMFATKKNVEELSIDQIAKLVKGKSQRELEPYVTIDASVYNDMARALKQAGFIKTARLTNKIKAAVKDSLETLLRQVVSKSPVKKLTYKQVQPTLARAFKKMGVKLEKESNAMFALIRIIKDYGLIRGDVPEDVEAAAEPKQAAQLQESVKNRLARWHLLAGIKK